MIALAGIGFWLIVGDGEPTATFDGEIASYSGPESFEAGNVTFTFDATEYGDRVTFVVARMSDESLTMADLEAYAADNPGSQVADFVATSNVTYVNDEVVEKEIALTEGTWSVWANTAPDDTNEGHPAVIFEVTAAG